MITIVRPAVHHQTDPVRDCLEECLIDAREELSLGAGGQEHTAALPADIQRHSYVRTYAQTVRQPDELVRILVCVPSAVRDTSLEDLHGSATAGNRQSMHPDLNLPPPHRRLTRCS